jgi:hypothetical protein
MVQRPAKANAIYPKGSDQHRGNNGRDNDHGAYLALAGDIHGQPLLAFLMGAQNRYDLRISPC